MSGTCHEMIAATAKNMAEELYETLAKDNNWYARNPNRRAFVRRVWPSLVSQARATLAGMLGGSYPEELKEKIADALIKDEELRTVRRALGGKATPQLVRH